MYLGDNYRSLWKHEVALIWFFGWFLNEKISLPKKLQLYFILKFSLHFHMKCCLPWVIQFSKVFFYKNVAIIPNLICKLITDKEQQHIN